MTKIMAVVFTAMFAARCCVAQFSQTDKPMISVNGSAEVKVAPDEVMINAGVETRDADIAIAKQQNDDNVASSLKFLKASGIDDKDVQTDFMQIEPNFNYSNNSLASHVKPLFYSVRKSIKIKLKKPAEFDKLITGLLSHGVNNLLSVDFQTTELRKYRDQARQMAIRAAKEKAVALANELGVKVGAPLRINAQEYGGWRNWGYGSGAWGREGGQMLQNSTMNAGPNPGNNEGGSEAIAAGQISISATVDVTFLIQ